ncbi:MAG TPA: hypothetical protein VGG47_15355 [Acidocella sp.]
MTSDLRDEAIARLYRDRRLAHAVLFAHRHRNKTAPFHLEMIDDFHSEAPGMRNLCEIAFRGSAKSTLAEEGVCIKAIYREIKHGLIVGASLDKAQERLHSIRRQFEKNARLIELFGDMRSRPWGDDQIELTNGCTITAMGRGQAIRGTKNEDFRPDFILPDDIEDQDSVRSAETREKIQKWFFNELLPSGDEPTLRVRVLANDMHPECIANVLKRPDSQFVVKVYPWEYRGAQGERCATWPDRYPLETIELKRRQMYAVGRGPEYESDYMCHSESPESKPFKPEMVRVEPTIHTWQAVYSMKDPARTVGPNAAHTGSATWSWIANKLTVWDMWQRPLMPNEIVESLFAEHEVFHPVYQGVEADGLNEWLMQPIRQEQVRRGVVLPVRAEKAPKGKIDFIRALQPFAMAREIVFATENQEARALFANFPSGRIDAMNALAYALRMRPGAPIYEDFTTQNVAEELAPAPGRPCWLALNATQAMTTAVLVQLLDGSLRIFADWVREGDPGAILKDIVQEAQLVAGRNPSLVAGPIHFEQYNNVGLAQAARRFVSEVRRGVQPGSGRGEIRSYLRRTHRGMPALLVSSEARWTLNAVAGGYARAILKGGLLADFAEEGVYRVLMEGLESFAGLLKTGEPDDERPNFHYATVADGQPYRSSLPRRR